MTRLFLTATALLVCLPAIVHADSAITLQSADSRYHLALQAGWRARDFHVDNVQIGGENKKKGQYVEVVADDQKDYTDSLARYAEGKRDTMAMSLDNPRMDPGQRLKVNGRDAIRCQIHGQLPNTDVSVGYLLTVIKTKTQYIQIIAWTPESRFAGNLGEMQSLAGGFSDTSEDKN